MLSFSGMVGVVQEDLLRFLAEEGISVNILTERLKQKSCSGVLLGVSDWMERFPPRVVVDDPFSLFSFKEEEEGALNELKR